MVARRAVTALFLVQMIAFAVSAQEYGSASAGEIVLKPKGAAPITGSIGVSLSSGNDVLGRSSSPEYGLTLGGTLVQDRLWFFASGSRQEGSRSRFSDLELPRNATTGAIGARINGQLTGAQDFSAFFESARRPEFSTTGTASFNAIVPSSFLSLRYDAVLSSNTLFSASFTRNTRSAAD
jgi:hypothetical protein